jgi:hypothetical protein
MDPRSIIILGTIAIAITVQGVIFSEEGADAFKLAADPKSSGYHTVNQEPASKPVEHADAETVFLETVGAASSEEVHDALYQGYTLADIAVRNSKDIQSVVRLQMSELTKQLDDRLASGSISVEQYHAHKAELAGLITASVYGKVSSARG